MATNVFEGTSSRRLATLNRDRSGRNSPLVKSAWFALLISFLSLTMSIGCSGGLKSPLQASDLSGEDLESFLNSPFGYGPVAHTETVKEVFYSGDQDMDYEIGKPKYLGRKDGYEHFAIVIGTKGIPVESNNTIVYFESRLSKNEYWVDYVEQTNGKTIKKYEHIDQRNPVLLTIYPTAYFSTVAEEWEAQKIKLAEERAAKEKGKVVKQTTGGSSKNSNPASNQDYSRYKKENYTMPPENPALLIVNGRGTGSSMFPVIDDKYVYPLNLVAFIPLEGQILEKMNKAGKEKDGFILFYRRIGKYIDRSNYKGFDYDWEVQKKYINDTANAYTLKADDVLLYSEIMPDDLTREDVSMLLAKEFPSDASDEYKKGEYDFILNAFLNGGTEAVKVYISNRVTPQTIDEDELTVTLTEKGNGVVIARYNGRGDRIVIPSTIQGMPVREIGEEAFRWYDGSTSDTPWTDITIPDGVTTIRQRAFEGCNKLHKVNLPSTLEVIESGAFSGCVNLSSFEIPDTVSFIGDDAFWGCYKWSAKIPEGVISQSEVLPNIFRHTGLKNIVVPEGIKIIGREAFAGCKDLESITLPSTISEIYTLAFRGCEKLVTVSIPDSVEVIDFTNGDPRESWRTTARDCFEGCTKLNLASQAALKKRGYAGGF